MVPQAWMEVVSCLTSDAFLKLAAKALREVNHMKDKNGIFYSRKSMILTELSLSTEGMWSESQPTDELQALVSNYRIHFDGQPVNSGEIMTKSESEVDEEQKFLR